MQKQYLVRDEMSPCAQFVPILSLVCAHYFGSQWELPKNEYCLPCPRYTACLQFSINSNRSLTEHLNRRQRRSIVSRSTLVAVSLYSNVIVLRCRSVSRATSTTFILCSPISRDKWHLIILFSRKKLHPEWNKFLDKGVFSPRMLFRMNFIRYIWKKLIRE